MNYIDMPKIWSKIEKCLGNPGKIPHIGWKSMVSKGFINSCVLRYIYEKNQEINTRLGINLSIGPGISPRAGHIGPPKG